MALQMKVKTAHGIFLDAAYIRIDDQSGKAKLNLLVRTYTSAENCQSGYQWIAEEIYSFTPSVEDGAPNFIKQGYEHLKSLPQFLESTDVLE